MVKNETSHRKDCDGLFRFLPFKTESQLGEIGF